MKVLVQEVPVPCCPIGCVPEVGADRAFVPRLATQTLDPVIETVLAFAEEHLVRDGGWNLVRLPSHHLRDSTLVAMVGCIVDKVAGKSVVVVVDHYRTDSAVADVGIVVVVVVGTLTAHLKVEA